MYIHIYMCKYVHMYKYLYLCMHISRGLERHGRELDAHGPWLQRAGNPFERHRGQLKRPLNHFPSRCDNTNDNDYSMDLHDI